MPWKEIPTDILRQIIFFLTLFVVIFLATIMRIIDEVRRGERRRFFTWKLFCELPGVIVVMSMALGISEYFDFGMHATLAVGTIMGWLGPPLVMSFIKSIVISFIERWDHRK